MRHLPYAALAVVACAALVLIAGCASTGMSIVPMSEHPTDPLATEETRILYANLKRVSADHVMFGHQDALAYGVDWVREPGRSDVKDVTGSYPAVFGWELGDLELGAEENLDDVNFEDMKGWIREGYEHGAVITIAWHMNNPVSGGNAWDTTRAIQAILPGAEKHDLYVEWLDRFAEFADDLKSDRSWFLGSRTHIPVVFRPFHEHTGSWFWWGGDNVTAEEYVRLWRFTVDYLREEKGLHHLLFAYSTDVFDTEEEYLRFWPGDEYVDVMGYDDYHALSSDAGVDLMSIRLRKLVEMAEQRGKVAALTETGSEGIPMPAWWTDRLLRAVQADPVGSRIAWVLVWRNANRAQIEGHHYAPYAGHSSAPDFVEFYRDPFVLFADELPDLYEWSPDAPAGMTSSNQAEGEGR